MATLAEQQWTEATSYNAAMARERNDARAERDKALSYIVSFRETFCCDVVIRVQKCPLFCIFDLNGVHFLEFKGHFCLLFLSLDEILHVIHRCAHFRTPGEFGRHILLTKMSYQRT